MNISQDRLIKVKKETSPLNKYLDSKILTIMDFSKISKIHHNILYGIAKGTRTPRRTTAVRICKATKGELTLNDFGFQ